jgi:hypothetical protein
LPLITNNNVLSVSHFLLLRLAQDLLELEGFWLVAEIGAVTIATLPASFD